MIDVLDAPIVTPKDGPAPALIQQQVELYHEQWEDGHKRLRRDVSMQEGRLDALLAKQIDLEARYTALSMQRPDLSTAIIPARYVAAIVICCLTIAVAIWRVELKLDAYQETLSDLKKEVKLYELKTDGVEKKLISAGIIKE